MYPLISVIVPCYNQAEYLSECLLSVLAQTYQNWECIIVNDGSNDESVQIAQRFVVSENRFTLIDKLNGGLSSARNSGIRFAKGSFILPLDGDDKIAPLYMELAMKTFNKNPNIDLVYGRAEFFGERIGEWMLLPYSYKRLLKGNIIYCSSIYKKTLFTDNFFYDEQMKSGYEDWEFLVNHLDHKHTVYQLPVICFFYRIKNISMWQELNKNPKVEYSAIYYVIKKNFAKYVDTFGFWYSANLLIKQKMKVQFYPILQFLKLVK